jgi:hypothetical protein
VGAVDLNSKWPAEGHVGKVVAGEYEGAWALVTREADDLWFVYLAWQTSPVHYDDFHTTDALIGPVLAAMNIQWSSPEEDRRVENEVFGLRAEWSNGRPRH